MSDAAPPVSFWQIRLSPSRVLVLKRPPQKDSGEYTKFWAAKLGLTRAQFLQLRRQVGLKFNFNWIWEIPSLATREDPKFSRWLSSLNKVEAQLGDRIDRLVYCTYVQMCLLSRRQQLSAMRPHVDVEVAKAVIQSIAVARAAEVAAAAVAVAAAPAPGPIAAEVDMAIVAGPLPEPAPNAPEAVVVSTAPAVEIVMPDRGDDDGMGEDGEPLYHPESRCEARDCGCHSGEETEDDEDRAYDENGVSFEDFVKLVSFKEAPPKPPRILVPTQTVVAGFTRSDQQQKDSGASSSKQQEASPVIDHKEDEVIDLDLEDDQPVAPKVEKKEPSVAPAAAAASSSSSTGFRADVIDLTEAEPSEDKPQMFRRSQAQRALAQELARHSLATAMSSGSVST